MICFIDGKINNFISIKNRAIHFGDGCFTTIRVVKKKPALLLKHICRLQNGVKKLYLPEPNWQKIIIDINKIANLNKNKLGVIKVIITRSWKKNNIGYSFKNNNKVIVIIILNKYPFFYLDQQKKGINLAVSNILINANKHLSEIKHLNRLEQILIKKDIENKKIDEVITINTYGHLIGCCSGNIFWRKGKNVYTPYVNISGVAGVMREHIIEILSNNKKYKLFYVKTKPNILLYANEVIITNSLMPILPINNIFIYKKKWKYNSKKLFNFLLPYCLKV
ncbi:MAG: aminodeoxychorismate lyase [Arsenophonus sp.]|nr:MAG: aminodeoxychorismate lyase [Arsenophonus sp.]